MTTEILVEQGAVIGYVLVGLIALVGLGVIQLIRRRGDLKRARVAVRLASYSINEPRSGPIAVSGSYHEANAERWLECSGQRVALNGELEIGCGTSARWRNGVRTYAVRNGDTVLAIGVMSKLDGGWRIVPSAGEAGIQLVAMKPRPAPAPLWPWRAPHFLAVCGAIGFGGLYGLGTVLVDPPTACTESSRLRFEIAAALPQVREQALSALDRCRKLAP